MPNKTPVALTIAGSDPSGGAGIQADLKTFHQFGVYAEAAITLITVQNTLGVQRVEVLQPDLIEEQVRGILADVPPDAAKLGALGNRTTVEALARMAGEFTFPLVVDPVMVSKHGSSLLEPGAVDALRTKLAPHAFLITPNLPEASLLTGCTVDSIQTMRDAARRLAGEGTRNVLVKGGHLEGDPVDILYHDGSWYEYPGARVDSRQTHGTGCTLSAAVTAGLAKGWPLPMAVDRAKRYVQEAIRSAPQLGHGSGPLNHFGAAP
jgi:hydroxymethylpyrimidine/phosphomethylpyrimidine kinase